MIFVTVGNHPEGFNRLIEYVDKLKMEKIINDNVLIQLGYTKYKPKNCDSVKFLEFEEFKEETVIRLDQEIENRTKAFERIEELEEQLKLLEQYTIKGLQDSLRELQYNIDVKLERIDDILVVHSNQSDSQRKNHFQLQKVFSDKVMELLEGKHGK